MDTDIVVKAFSDLAPTYEATVDREVREFCGLGYHEFIRLLADKVPRDSGERVLDIACGTAVSTLEIAARSVSPPPSTQAGRGRRSGSVVGLDITPAMLRRGARNVAEEDLDGRVRLVCGSGMEMPLSPRSFDVVVCGLGMHHMRLSPLLAEIKRVLRPGGRLVMADMGAPAHWRSSWGRAAMHTIVAGYRLVRRHARAQAEADAFHNIHTAAEWRAILGNYGFDDIHVDEWPPRRFWYPSAVLLTARG